MDISWQSLNVTIFFTLKKLLDYIAGRNSSFDHHGNEVSLSRPFRLVCFNIFPVKVGGEFVPLLLSGIMRTYRRV